MSKKPTGKRRINPDAVPDRQAEFIRCYREFRGRMAHACLAANVTKYVVEGWIERDPVFEADFEQVRALVEDDKREVRDELAYDVKDRTMLVMALKGSLPEHRERSEVVHSGQINHAHAHVALENLTREEKERILSEGTRLIRSGEEA